MKSTGKDWWCPQPDHPQMTFLDSTALAIQGIQQTFKEHTSILAYIYRKWGKMWSQDRI